MNHAQNTLQTAGHVSRPAPAFKCGAVVKGEIKTLSLADFKSRWVVLLFYPKARMLGWLIWTPVFSLY